MDFKEIYYYPFLKEGVAVSVLFSLFKVTEFDVIFFLGGGVGLPGIAFI